MDTRHPVNLHTAVQASAKAEEEEKDIQAAVHVSALRTLTPLIPSVAKSLEWNRECTRSTQEAYHTSPGLPSSNRMFPARQEGKLEQGEEEEEGGEEEKGREREKADKQETQGWVGRARTHTSGGQLQHHAGDVLVRHRKQVALQITKTCLRVRPGWE